MFNFSFLKKNRLDEWQLLVEQVNQFEPEFERLNQDQLKEKTEQFKTRSQQGESLDDILPAAFAVVREAAKRTLKQRHYDVQILGGIGLHKGMVVEMMTGEGKTLVATLPVYLNALAGNGVHIVTVNDYLAQRDAVWMGQIYHLLGLSVGCIVHDTSYIYDPAYTTENQNAKTAKNQNYNSKVKIGDLDEKRDLIGGFKVVHEFLRPISRQEVYQLDIAYGTNHEFGFDYLRDNLVSSPAELVQRELNYAIIDEVDSILIDEARTPLIISSYEKEAEAVYSFFDKLAKRLKPETQFTIDEKRKAVYLTEAGQAQVEQVLQYNPYLVEDLHAVHHLEEALKANHLFFRDKDYIVKQGQVVIVDEFTGRLMWGRRWSGGLHQAVEAKENVAIQPESKTVASITIQNLFKRYRKLAGMSGTVMTSAEEFHKVYGLEAAAIPSHQPCIRIDQADKIYLTEKAKWQAITDQLAEMYKLGRPVLIGTTSIEKNEFLTQKLKEKGVPHQILNAKNNEQEALIIAQAGQLKSITVATNMAGRGVDIILGGNPQDQSEAEKVKELGGLLVVGTERHEARRIDNQLRGRSGRQGDPGETQFFLSLEDDLIRVFGGEMIKQVVTRFKFPEEQPIEHSLISKTIAEAQAKIEGLNFDIRKHLLEYDNIVNAQREKIYAQRKQILLGEVDQIEFINSEFELFLTEPVETIRFVLDLPDNPSGSATDANGQNNPQPEFEVDLIELAQTKFQEQLEKIKRLLESVSSSRPGEDNEKNLKSFLQLTILRMYDYLWSEHLSYLDEVKESVGYRAYGQRDPLIEFKKEALESFNNFHKLLRFNLFQYLMKIDQPSAVPQLIPNESQSTATKVGRNDPCPCGAKKADGAPVKYKKCHGR